MGAIDTDFVRSIFNLIKEAAAREDGRYQDNNAFLSFSYEP